MLFGKVNEHGINVNMLSSSQKSPNTIAKVSVNISNFISDLDFMCILYEVTGSKHKFKPKTINGKMIQNLSNTKSNRTILESTENGKMKI